MKRLLITVLLVLSSAMTIAQTSVWDGSRALWTRGKGTQTSPYLIESASHLAYLAYMVNKGYETAGMYFRLTTDIDLNGSVNQPWIPIGLGDRLFNDDGCERESQSPVPVNYHTTFRGHFDGGSHGISNVYIDYSDSYYCPYVGLFGVVEGKTDGAVVEPASIENVFVTSGYIKGSVCGGIVGNGSSSTSVSRCWNGATIEATGEGCGGIVGCDAWQVKNAYNIGSISGFCAGGIMGFVQFGDVVIQECYNEGVVSGACSGGIFGKTFHNSVSINNCYNKGTITNEGWDSYSSETDLACGGIACFLFQTGNSSVTNCYNVGEVSSSHDSGCILAYDFKEVYFENNYFIGSCYAGGKGVALKENYMRSTEFVDRLNEGNIDLVWAVDVNNINDGFPVLLNDNFGAKSKNKPVLIVYPNPSHGKLTVEGTGYMMVTNILGQTVIAKEIKGQQIITLPKGMYLISLRGVTKKVVVE